MEYTLELKYKLIKEEIVKYKGRNPIELLLHVMKKEYISMHGPEHHYLDGACFLVAYKNACGDIDLSSSLNKLADRTIKMPGATCGHWGVCGSVTSIGAALSIIHDTGPLSNDNYYKDHMEYTSLVLSKMSKVGGPRCCKRNAFISILTAVQFVKDKYGIEMEFNDINCKFSSKNKQCIVQNCPFYERSL